MPRRMSCALTIDAVRAETKDVTRRHIDTWKTLRPGDRLTLVEKAMGLPAGTKQVVVAEVEIVSVRIERLAEITPEEIRREGVGVDWSPRVWADWWKLSHGYRPEDDPEVRRIEWKYLR